MHITDEPPSTVNCIAMKIRDHWAMESRPLPSELTPEEARVRAVQYRQMADAARTADIRAALLRLAERYERLAPESLRIEPG